MKTQNLEQDGGMTQVRKIVGEEEEEGSTVEKCRRGCLPFYSAPIRKDFPTWVPEPQSAFVPTGGARSCSTTYVI